MRRSPDPMNVLITGGFGFVGGRLATAMSSRLDVRVFLGSRAVRQAPSWLPEAIPVQTDWGSTDKLDEVLRGIDLVVHLATTNAAAAARDPKKAVTASGDQIARLVESAKRQEVARLIYLSTAHVYGELSGRIDEEMNPEPRHPYAESHRVAERAVLASAPEEGATGVVLRPSNAFGAPVKPDTDCWTLVVNDLCRQAVTTGELRLHAPQMQRRDFITMTDLCRAVLHVIQTPDESLGDGIFNVGGDWAPTTLQMAERIQRCCTAVLGTEPEIITNMADPDEIPPPLEFCIDKMGGTGFELDQNWDEELEELLLFCQANFGGHA